MSISENVSKLFYVLYLMLTVVEQLKFTVSDIVSAIVAKITVIQKFIKVFSTDDFAVFLAF